MIIPRRDIPATYFIQHVGDAKIQAAKSSFHAWYALSLPAMWIRPQDIKAMHPKASILKSGRVVFNIKGNDYRLICKVNYLNQVVEIRWFGSHSEYDINAETI